jgi:hypothetical protein
MRLNIPRSPFEHLASALSLAHRTQILQTMLNDGSFHHATMRTDQNLRGLYIYGKQDNGYNGFTLVTSFNPYDGAAMDLAYDMVRKTGVYENSYR